MHFLFSSSSLGMGAILAHKLLSTGIAQKLNSCCEGACNSPIWSGIARCLAEVCFRKCVVLLGYDTLDSFQLCG